MKSIVRNSIDFLDVNKIYSNLDLHEKLGIFLNASINRFILKDKYGIQSPYEGANAHHLLVLQYDELKLMDMLNRKTKSLSVSMILNDLKSIETLKQEATENSQLALIPEFINFIVLNCNLQTFRFVYQTFKQSIINVSMVLLQSAIKQNRKKIFQWILSDVLAEREMSYDFIAGILAERRWFEYFYLIKDKAAFRKECLLDNLTFDEMTEHDLHSEYDIKNHFPNNTFIENILIFQKNEDGTMMPKKLCYESAIIDEKNVSRYGLRSLRCILDIYPNRLELYQNCYCNSNSINIPFEMTIETLIELKKKFPYTLFEITIESNIYLRLYFDENYKYESILKDNIRNNNFTITLDKYCNYQVLYYAYTRDEIFYHHQEAGFDRQIKKYLFNLKFLLVVLRINLRRFSKYNFHIWYNVRQRMAENAMKV